MDGAGRKIGPLVSSGGNLFGGLLANTLNNGEIVDVTTVHTVLPFLKSFFKSLGFKDEKSSYLWQQFLSLKTGETQLMQLGAPVKPLRTAPLSGAGSL